ncbi:hypothetical protein XM25_15190 [Devosia sp. H5989]|nr:hypothetical protein XM25_15190 [Devosia sp. H5989]
MTRILSGTATVVAGDRTVAFSGPPLSDANCPVDGSVVLAGAAYFIASRTDTSHFELTRDYEGTDGTVSCEIDPLNANAINLVKVARQITEYNAKLALTDAYGKGLFYECIGFTGANDPAPGKLARNAAAWSDTTEIYMDVLDAGGHEQGALIDLARAGTAYIVRAIDTGAYAAFVLSAAPVNMGPDEWRKISLEYVDGDGIIADGELVAVEWNRKGEQGDSFAADAEVDTLGERDAFDDEAAGFVLKVNDVGDGRAAFFTMGTGGSADWGAPAYLTGTKGDQGDPGDKGWSPKLVGLSDGERRVLMLDSYVGGAGAPPAANVGEYLKADGTFTADIAEAENYRGPPGTGNGTVIGPPSSVAGHLAVFSDATGELIGDSGKTVADLVPAGYDDLLVSVSLLALQVADNSNAALFLGATGNRVADSFDALTYVDVAGATNLDTSVAGVLKATRAAGVSIVHGANPPATGPAGGWSPATSMHFGTPPLTNGATYATLGVYLSAGATVILKIVKRNSSTNVDVVAQTASFTHPGGGWADTSLTAPFEVPATGDYFVGCYFATDSNTLFNSGVQRSNASGNITGSNVTVPAIAAGSAPSVRATTLGAIQNLTVRSTAFVAAVAPTKMTALLCVKEVDAAVAGTDYTLECSRDGGTTWAAMALSELFTSSSPTASVRVVEADETDVSGQPLGTAPRWRFKTLNTKAVELHAACLYWS